MKKKRRVDDLIVAIAKNLPPEKVMGDKEMKWWIDHPKKLKKFLAQLSQPDVPMTSAQWFEQNRIRYEAGGSSEQGL